MNGNLLSRIRRQAATNVFGTPDSNCEYLPILRAKMEGDRHKMEFFTISASEMKAVLIGVGRD